MKRSCNILLSAAALWTWAADVSLALNGGTLRVTPRNSWRAFEVISIGDNPAGDGFNYAMLGIFDGVGAWQPDAATLRLVVNHEEDDGAISEVNLNLTNFQTAIRNTINSGTTGSVSFVDSARQAYGRWSNNGGANWIPTTDISNTSFSKFCSGQSHPPNTFGIGRGFVDDIYITGEEFTATNRLFAVDLVNRDFYQLSGVAGSASGGIGGMPFDSYENAALLDTGETNHVAMLLSADGGSETLQMYIGQKGKDAAGNASSSFLARNGLAYGSWYYLNDTLPPGETSNDGFFDTTLAGAVHASKLEDVDTNPNDPTKVVLGVQETGLFTLDFNLNFGGGSFSAGGSSFSITKIQNHNNNADGLFGDADNVDWTVATTLGGESYPNGLIFVNEDSGTDNGETWMMTPTGGGLTKIADTAPTDIATTETSGILDISKLVGFKPGSVLVTTNQGTSASLTVLIHPNAALAGDFNGNGKVDAADYVVWRNGLGATYTQNDYNIWRSQFGQTPASFGAATGVAIDESAPVPEPSAIVLSLVALSGLVGMRRYCCANIA
jgi:hypothetical protein